MAAVFDTTNKTPRRVKDPATDDTLPSLGSLGWGGIASDSALSGATGADCILVSGDRWQQMNGKLTENYSGDKKIDVQGKHTETIMGNRNITVTSGNIERSVSAGKVTDQIALNHEETVGVLYKLSAATVNVAGSTLVNINGGLVKINS
jgi:type VI secretion system secreted protein VgrG